MLTLIDVKFPSSFASLSANSQYKGMLSQADILQMHEPIRNGEEFEMNEK